MSKIICNICGMSYPDTEDRCPICGCVRPANAPVVADAPEEKKEFTYVKGGRFSKNNVKKRNGGKPVQQTAGNDRQKRRGLFIVLAIIFVLFLAMALFFAFKLLKDDDGKNTSVTEEHDVPCTALKLSISSISFDAIGDVWMLDVTRVPSNTTEPLAFESDNSAVATVDENGKIECVGEGVAVITVSCGGQRETCTVYCTLPTEQPQLPTVPPTVIQLNRKSIQFFDVGESWTVYAGDIPFSEILWVSEDTSVATFNDGVVVAVGEGKTTIYAVYEGRNSEPCEIECTFTQEQPTSDINEGGTIIPEKPGVFDPDDFILAIKPYNTRAPYNDSPEMQCYDLTIQVGQEFGLDLRDKNGTSLDTVWEIVEGAESCTLKNNRITATSSKTNVKLKTVYNGITVYCYLRTVNG